MLLVESDKENTKFARRNQWHVMKWHLRFYMASTKMPGESQKEYSYKIKLKVGRMWE